MEIETLNYIIKTYTEVDNAVINAKPKAIKCMNLNLKSRQPISVSKGDIIYMFNPKTLYYNDIEQNSEFFIDTDSIDCICIFDEFNGREQMSKNLHDMLSKILGGK